MDRNIAKAANSIGAIVALRKESVDRNRQTFACWYIKEMSLSARRAWIEIRALQNTRMDVSVALRKESVDRNAA